MSTITIEVGDNSYISIGKFLDSLDDDILINANKEFSENKIIYSHRDSNERQFVHKVSDMLTKCIIEKYETVLIDKIIHDNYCQFNRLERNKITEVAKKIVDGNDSIVDKMVCVKRKNYIYKRLVEYLKSNEHIILEGFINFRLKEYLKDLETVIDKAVNVYLTQKEYDEFINLLKYFVEIQEPKIDIVYLTLYSDGDYELCDKYSKDVSYLYMEEMREEILSNKLSKEDILLGALITISPAKIVLNKEGEDVENSEIFNTINSIFQDRIM